MTTLDKRFCVILVTILWNAVSSLAQTPQGAEFQVNSYTTSAPESPAVASL